MKTRKPLTMHRGFHPKSSSLRLYTKWKAGGQGPVSIRASVQDEMDKISEYIRKMAPRDKMLSEYLRHGEGMGKNS